MNDYLETTGVVERRLAEEGNAIAYALTPWGSELREPIEGLIRWSTPLMARGRGDDHFRTEWLAADGELVQVRATRSGIDVSQPDGRDLDAVVHTDAATVLGLAAGALTLNNTRSQVKFEGDEAAVRAVFDTPTRQDRNPSHQ